MFDTIMARLTQLAGEVFDPSIRIYYPDDEEDWTKLAADGRMFVRVRPPQLAESRPSFGAFACYFDVCHSTFREAKREADNLVNFLTRPRDRYPSTAVQPVAYPVKEAGYWRVTVGFTQMVKYIPPTTQGG